MNRISQVIKYADLSSRRYFDLAKREVKDPLHRNSLFLIADAIALAGLGVFFWMVVANFYTKTDVGLAAAIISVLSLLAVLSRLGLGIAIVRFLPRAEKPAELINSCLTFSGMVAVAVALVYIAGVDIWSPKLAFIREDPVFLAAFVLFTLFSTLHVVVERVFIAKRRADLVLAKSIIFGLLKIGLPFLMVVFFRAFGIVSSWGVALGLSLVVALVILLPRVQKGYKLVPRLNLGIIQNIWRYSAGNYFAILFGFAPTHILPILILHLKYLGAEHTAYFYIAWRIASLLYMIPTQAAKSLFAEGSHFEEKLAANVRRSYKFTYLLLVPAVLVVLVAGKWLLLLFDPTEGSYAANALPLLRVLACSSVFVAVNHIYYSVLKVQGRLIELTVLRAFIFASVVVGTFLLTQATGVVGVGYAWIGAQGLVSAYVLLAMPLRHILRRA